ncbi:MAG: hypothetical protein K8W52_29705 [Deltaproteobacteria bacterium]|nr:hypothetical protein [Deltaproteobacteria bacterium]
MRRAISAVLFAALATAAAPASAHGQFPITRSVFFQPGANANYLLGTTFGLMVTHDDGANFYIVCEQTVGYGGVYEPAYEFAADGTIYATTPTGLTVSHDGGCSFEVATASLTAGDPNRFAGENIGAIELGPDQALWAATATATTINKIYVSRDGGQTFTASGLEAPNIDWNGIAAAPGDATRLYVSGQQRTEVLPDDAGIVPPTVHLRRTDTSGASWVDLPITDFDLAISPNVVVLGVSPTSADTVFAASIGAAGSGDRLYRSTDAGAHWTAVLDTVFALRSLVFRTDGSIVVATPATDGKNALFTSADGGATFTPVSGVDPKQLEAACLGERADGTMFGCGTNWDPDYAALARAPGLGPWTKVFRFVDLRGPVSCPAGTVQHDVCELEQWPMLKQFFGITDPLVDGAPAMPDAGTAPGGDTGCCSASGDAGGAIAVAALVGVGLWLARRRKKRCCQ